MSPRSLLASCLFLLAGCAASPPPAPPPPPAPQAAPAQPAQLAASPDPRPYLASRRQTQIMILRAYADQGVFPRNFTSDSPTHRFRDQDGRLCAVANLIALDGKMGLVDQVARTRNDVLVSQEASGPLHDWVLTSGLTREEIHRIQEPAPRISRGTRELPLVVPSTEPTQAGILPEPGEPDIDPPDAPALLPAPGAGARAPRQIRPRWPGEPQMVEQMRAHFAAVLVELSRDEPQSLALAARRYSESPLARASSGR